ncbi:MAG: hypothetical protein RJA59_1129 [Pseudomonadota bacterium]
MLTGSDEARVMNLHRSSVSRARQNKTHPVHREGVETIEFGVPEVTRMHLRVSRRAVEAWWAKRWGDASPDDLARKRRRPAPVKETRGSLPQPAHEVS